MKQLARLRHSRHNEAYSVRYSPHLADGGSAVLRQLLESACAKRGEIGDARWEIGDEKWERRERRFCTIRDLACF